MNLKDSSAVQSGRTKGTMEETVVFAKRSRGKRARKRPRSSLDDEEETAPFPVRTIPRKESNVKASKRWSVIEQAFESEKKSSFVESRATAERLDTGGDNKSSTSEKSKKPFGPLSAPSHLRTSVRVDYQPDVCKDYKETGYCGFGDSCKFLHDRSDYKAGWQLDRDWAEKEKKRTETIIHGEGPDKGDSEGTRNALDDDGLPFACFICRDNFTVPVMTLCAHYFCEECILRHMEKNSACPVCKKPLKGTLNPAPKLQRRLERRQKEQSG